MERTFETPDMVGLIVENAVGSITISAEEIESTHVRLEAETPEAEELVERATVECVPYRGGLVVQVKIRQRHGPRFMRRNGVIVHVTLPNGADVEVVSGSGAVDLSGHLGDLRIKTASAPVDADVLAGQVDVATASGDVVVGQAAGPVKFKSASGDLRVVQSDGRVTAVTASGTIEVGAVRGGLEVRGSSSDVRVGQVEGDVRIVSVSGDIRVSSYLAGRLHARTVSGDVRIGVAAGVKVSVDAESMSGPVHSDIALSDAPPHQSAGGAEVSVTAQTVSGAVLIERAAEAVVV
jgi:hypothetical protein